jgi:hypothetical protein
VEGGGTAFAIHAADGTPMALAGDIQLAAAAILQHDMVPALVHERERPGGAAPWTPAEGSRP